MSIEIDILLILVAGIASIIDTIAGGGGLMVVPALLLSGIPPAMALGTNKLQATLGCGVSATSFLRAGKIQWHQIRFGILFCFIGASIGTLTIIHLNPDFLRKLMPILIFCILLYMIFFKKSGQEQKPASMPYNVFFIVFGLILGFYDGFFGPGTGSFWVAAMIILLGWNIKQATMHAKIYNFVSNLFSLLWFIINGHVLFSIGLMMAMSSMMGAKIGAQLVIHKSTTFIKPLYIVMMTVLLILMVIKQS